MNCIAKTAITPSRPVKYGPHHSAKAALAGALLVLLAGCGVSTSESAGETQADDRMYRVEFTVTPDRTRSGAAVEMKVSQTHGTLRELQMSIDPARISELRSSEGLNIVDDVVTWVPGEKGGSIRWFAHLRHQRGDGGYDAFIDSDWAMFRAEDIVPRAATRTLKGATSETWLTFSLPASWSSVTPYFGRNHRYRIDNPDRRFDLPGGWIALGNIGVRFDTIAGTLAKIAAPEGHDVRRMDMLALLNWTLPEVRRLMPGFPERLTIVSAAAPMWRGGLSGPQSLYIHADRPLISENATSTLLHEVFHVGFTAAAAPGADWIIEGLAEYYSLQFLVRSGGISGERFNTAMAGQEKWGNDVKQLCARRSSGPVTARAVTIFAKLDEEIRAASGRRFSLDDVVREIANDDSKISLAKLQTYVTKVSGKKSDTLAEKNLPGCKS